MLIDTNVRAKESTPPADAPALDVEMQEQVENVSDKEDDLVHTEENARSGKRSGRQRAVGESDEDFDP